MAESPRKESYQLIRVITAGRIIVGRRRGYDKDKLYYDALDEELDREWALMLDRKAKQKHQVGDHVLIQSQSLEKNGCKRGIVTYRNKNEYTVFLYDHAVSEDMQLESDRIAAMKPSRRDELPPRTLIVQLWGVVPARLVQDLAKKMTGASNLTNILTQESQWPRKTNIITEEWLDRRNSRYLLVDTIKSNTDGSVYGDIYRRLADDKSDTSVPALSSKPCVESLSNYLINSNLAMKNESLRESQFMGSVANDSHMARRKGKSQEVEAVCKTPTAASSNSAKSSVQESKEITISVEETLQMYQCNDPVNPEFELMSKELSKPAEVLRDTSSMRSDPRPAKTPNDVDDYLTLSSSASTSSDGSSVLREASECIEIESSIPGRLLVRGSSARQPYSSLLQFSLPHTIVQALDTSGIRDLTDFQKTVAPNFIRAGDLIMVAAEGAGQNGKHARELGYILPIIRLVYEKYMGMDPHDAQNCSPEAIIVVNSFNAGLSIEHFFQSLLSYCAQMPLRVKFLCKDIPDDPASRRHFENRMLPKGISVLITTVDYLDALLKTRHGADLCDNLTYIIFEELDMYMKKYWDDIVMFVGCLRQNIRLTGRDPFQLTFSASRWSPEMEPLYKLMFQERVPTIIIDAVNQVLRFAKVKWVVHHIEAKNDVEEAKLNKLCEIIESDRDFKTIVSCSSSAVAKSVCDGILQKTMCSAQHITPCSRQESLQYARKLWGSNRIGILVISDDMIRNFSVTDATRLISYDSPIPQIVGGKRRSIAAERFGSLWSNIRHIEEEVEDNPTANTHFLQPTQSLIAHFLVTGDEYNFYPMYRFAMSLEGDVVYPDKLKKQALQMEHDGSCNIKMCEGLKLFGYCNLRDPTSCTALHGFTAKELALEPAVPRIGEIEVRFKRCSSPSVFQVQLLRHFTFHNGKRILGTSYIKELHRRHQIMKTFYGPDSIKAEAEEKDTESSSGMKMINTFGMGTMCAVLHPLEKTYTRAKIESVVQTDKSNVPTQLRVFCIDIGDYLNPKVGNVYKLPEEFQLWKPLVVNLILSNLKPTRGELEYRRNVENRVRALFTDKIFNAKVWISIGDTVWVNPLVEYGVDVLTKESFKKMSARLELLQRSLADFNGDHLKNLITMLKKHENHYQEVSVISQELGIVGIKSSILTDELDLTRKQFFQLGDDYHWAFIGWNADGHSDSVSVSVMFGYNPSLFYGAIDKFQDELKRLEKELNKTIEKYIAGDDGGEEDTDDENGNMSFANYDELFKDMYEPNLVVAVKERVEQKWMRAIILSRYELEAGPLFKVFFVDYGDVVEDVTLKELFPLPNNYVNRMPFQAIALKLDHIEPVMQQGKVQFWTTKAKEEFLDLVLPGGMSESVEVVALDYINEYVSHDDPLTPCRYYSVVAIHPDGNDLESMLVTRGLASWIPGKAEIVTEIKKQLLSSMNQTVNRLLGEEENDVDADSLNFNGGQFPGLEGFEIQLDLNYLHSFVNRVAGKNGIKTPKPSDLLPIQEESNVGGSAADRQHTSVTPAPVVAGPSTNCERSPMQQTLTPNDIDGEALLHPKVFWRQTDTDVILTVVLPDIKQFSVKILPGKRTVTFRTLKMTRDYGFSLKLFGKVAEYNTHLTGQHLRIVLKKQMNETKWPRILYDNNERNRFLSMDISNLNCDDGEKENIAHSYGSDVSDDEGNNPDPEEIIEALKENLSVTENNVDDEDCASADLVDLGNGKFLG